MNQTLEVTATYRFSREELIEILSAHVARSTGHTPSECVSFGTNEEEINESVYIVFRHMTQRDLE